MANINRRFDGPTKVAIRIVGYDKPLVLKVKEGGFLCIKNSAISGYRGVKPQPFTLRQVMGIESAEYAYADSYANGPEEVGRAEHKLKGGL